MRVRTGTALREVTYEVDTAAEHGGKGAQAAVRDAVERREVTRGLVAASREQSRSERGEHRLWQAEGCRRMKGGP